MAKEKEKKVAFALDQIEVEDVTGAMYLAQHYGNGTLGKTKFDASFTLPTMALKISVGEKVYLVPMQQIITKVIEQHEK